MDPNTVLQKASSKFRMENPCIGCEFKRRCKEHLNGKICSAREIYLENRGILYGITWGISMMISGEEPITDGGSR